MKDKIFIYPTDTVWGIGGNIHLPEVYEGVVSIKTRDRGKPLSILFSSIEMLREYFDFPSSIDDQWLEGFFKLESTALIPLEWSRREIPKHITHDSPMVGVRCLKHPLVQEIIAGVGAPIITTSLNQAGEPPIIDLEEAQKFHSEHAPQAILMDKQEETLSGSPSSIIRLGDKEGALFLRKGVYAEELQKYVEVLTT